ncbi:MAG: hypothetical protein ACLUHA_03820 [Bacteroides stercoris]
MGRKNAAVWGNSRISEDDELKPVSKLERGGVRSMQFPTLVSLGWLHGLLRKHLGKMFLHPLIPLDGNYVKCLNACEPIVFHIPNGKKAQLLFLRPTDGLSSFDFLYESANFSYKEDKQQQINFHYGCKVKTF